MISASRAGTALMIVSMVLVLAGPQVLIPEAVPLAAALGSVAAGVGTGLANLAWGVCLARVEAEALERTVLGWYPVFAAVFLLLALSAGSDLPAFVLPALMVVLPAGSQVGLERYLGAEGKGQSARFGLSASRISQEGAYERGPSGVGGFRALRGYVVSLAYLLCAFAASSFVWSAFLSRQAVSFGTAMLLFAVGVGLLAVITWIAFARTRHFGLSTLFRWSLPCMALAGAAAALGGVLALSLSCVLLAAVYIGLDSIAKLYFAYAAKRCPQHAAEVFGWGLITGSVGGLVGAWLWDAIEVVLQVHDFALIMLLGLVPFTLAAAIVIGRDPFLGNVQGEDGVFGVLVDDGEKSEPSAFLEVTARVPRGEAACADEVAIESGGPSREEGGLARKGEDVLSLDARCAHLAKQFGLTPRELDVVRLLAQGRSRTYIRETLYISKGTVDTHAYHAYAKCGVKSKDELMRLLDQL